MHSVQNLLKFNHGALEVKIDYETMSLDELKRNYIKYKSLTKDKKCLSSLSDKGEKLLNQLKHIEDVARRRCMSLAVEFKESEASTEEDVGKLLDKFRELVHMREAEVKPEPVKSEKSPAKLGQGTKEASASVVPKIEPKQEALDDGYQQILGKIKDETLRDEMAKDLKSEDNQAKLEKADQLTKLVKIDPSKNYFAKNVVKKEKKADIAKLNEVKAKILHKIQVENKAAKEISIEESYRILKEHEKKIQDIQIQQTAQKLLQGQSVVYDYSFLNSTEKDNLRYRDRKPRNDYDLALNDDDDDENDSDDNDEDVEPNRDDGYLYHDEYAASSANSEWTTSSIDRLHISEKGKHKFKNDDLNSVD